MSLSLKALKAVMAQETGEVSHTLVTFDHPNMGTTQRFVDQRTSVTSNGLVYNPLDFDMEFMDEVGDGTGEVRFQVKFADQTLIKQLLDLGPDKPTVDTRLVLASDLDTVVFENLGSKLEQVQITLSNISGRLGPESFHDDASPGILMSRENTPGLFP